MPAITNYKPRKRAWGLCFEVELDGAPWAEIADETMVARRLGRGTELTRAQAAEILAESNALVAKRRLARYLGSRVATREQARRHALQKLGVDADAAAGLAQWAVERGLVNDEAFAEAKASSVARQKKGPLMARMELRRAGVGRALADEAAAAHAGEEEQLAACLALLEKRWSRWEDEEPRKRRAKAAAFLARRGFESGPARKAVERAGLGRFEAEEEGWE